ncbi:hypothetical protein [Ideonella sp.]|uniref:hypothetical protein n=1 Tax=Ideonella sp. TaxID=1929293 RepID=UPI002B472F0C|nr:hypothetical protein [Ideonella sp.]HJV69496.1 hypothetical protein [Ideonella sp.]
MMQEVADRLYQALGHELRPAKSVRGLDVLPEDVLRDIEVIYDTCGGIYVFAYLYHVTDASFAEVKMYVDRRGWHHSAD